MNEVAVAVDPVTRFVRSLPGDYLLLREVAEQVGISHYTLRRFLDDPELPECQPSKTARIGKLTVYLYSPRDVARIEKFLEKRITVEDYAGKPKGRKRIYKPAERLDRKRARSRKWYWENRSRALADAGDSVGAREAMRNAREIGKELKSSGKS